MPTKKPEQKLSGWTLRDEIDFINKLGAHSDMSRASAMHVDTLLYRYKKALAAREVVSFDKSLAMQAISRRQAEIAAQVRHEQAAYGLVPA